MANPIIRIKRSSVPGKIPNASQVPLGEIALNTYDGKVFASRNVGIGTTVFVVNPWTVGTGTDTYNTYFTEGNVGIGTTVPSSRLSVNGNVNITGVLTATTLNAGIGTITTLSTTNLTAQQLNVSGVSTISVNSSTDALRITQIGTGNALVVEDSANPDSTPFVVNNSGNVGIGTTIPTSNLHVVGSTLITGIATVNNNLVVNGNTLFADANANRVGIGTTNPSARLSVNGDVSIASTVGIGTIIDIIPYDTLDGGTLSYEASTGQLLSVSNNLDSGIVFSVNDFSGSPSLEVLGDGTVLLAPYDTKVGIGSTIPSEKLDVLGNARISGIITTSAISVGSTLTHTGTTASLNNTTTANTLNLATGATGSGVLKTINVGTGGASGSRLLVNIGSATAGTASTVVVNSGTNVLIGSATSTGTASQPLQVTGGAYVSGSIGIGVTNPIQKLDVRGSAQITDIGNASFIEIGNGQNSNQFAFIDLIGDTTYTDYGLRIIRNNTGANTSSEIIHRGTGNFILRTFESSAIVFQTANTERVRIDPTGNVGIGTNIPIAPLHINSSSVHSNGTSFLRLISVGGLNYVQSGLTFTSGSETDLIFTSMLAATEWARFRGGNFLIGAATTTGTASQPLQVTGGAYVSGNLGVGVTNPANLLHISGSPGTILRIDGGAAGTGNRDIFISEFNTTAFGGIIRYDSVADLFTFGTVENSAVQYALNVSRSTGNIGIGYSTSLTAKLAVAGTTLINTTTATGTASQPLQVTGGAYVSGNLGVGATNPSDKLHVLSGNIRVDSTTGALTFWSGAGFFGGIGMAQAFGGSGTDLNLRADTNRNIIFQTGGANERVRITSTGNVGIGTTNPGASLEILAPELNGSTPELRLSAPGGGANGFLDFHHSLTGASYNNIVQTGDKAIIFRGTSSVGTGALVIAPHAPGTSGIRMIGSTGDVLIGSATPTGTASQPLQVTGGAYVSGNLGVGNTNTSFKLEVLGGNARFATGGQGDVLIVHSNLVSTLRAVTNIQLALGANNTEAVRIDLSGNVGIGTNIPSSRLHVLANEASGYAATFDNDGNNANRFGIRIQCGVDTGAGTAVAIDDGDGTNQGNITFNAGTVTYGAFTANHDCVLPSYEGEIPYGTLITTNEILYKKRPTGEEMERGILYSAGISTTPYSKRLLGAYSYAYDLDSPVQSGSDLPVHQVLVLGDGHILCCGEKGNIKFGDGITSSSREGIGMKMDKIGMVIGIAQEDVEFEEDEVKLVPVQYGLHQYIPDNIAESLSFLSE